MHFVRIALRQRASSGANGERIMMHFVRIALRKRRSAGFYALPFNAFCSHRFESPDIIPYHAYGGVKSTFLGLPDGERKDFIPTDGQINEFKAYLNL